MSAGFAEAFERALGRAYRYLGHRDRSVAELRRYLAGKEVEDDVAEAVVARLREQGYLDDARYAHRYAEDRRTLDGWGAERIAQRLAAAGIAREHVEAAVAAQDGEAELAAAIAVLDARLRGPCTDDRERDRALRLLARRGYDLDVAYDAIRAHARGVAPATGGPYDPGE